MLDAKTSKKILELAKDQKAEIDEDDWDDEESETDEPINGYVQRMLMWAEAC